MKLIITKNGNPNFESKWIGSQSLDKRSHSTHHRRSFKPKHFHHLWFIRSSSTTSRRTTPQRQSINVINFINHSICKWNISIITIITIFFFFFIWSSFYMASQSLSLVYKYMVQCFDIFDYLYSYLCDICGTGHWRNVVEFGCGRVGFDDRNGVFVDRDMGFDVGSLYSISVDTV